MEPEAFGPEMVARVRDAFGLPEDEPLQLLDWSDSLVVLARGAATVELPAAAQAGLPSLRVDVSTLPLSQVLNALNESRKSGLVHFAYRDHRKEVYLHDGEVVFATSNQRVDRLGECLLRAGVITLEQLREAERRFEPGERFGKVLVERGFLTPRELWNGVKYQVEEIVRSLFAVPGGTLWFWEGDAQPDNVVRLALETGRLVAEGLQRSAELHKFLAVLEDPRVRLAGVPGFDGTLAGAERAIADAIGAERAFEEVCEVLSFDRESAARSIQLLRLVGAVKLMRLPQETGFLDESDLRSADDQELRVRVGAMTKWIGELVSVLAGCEGEAAVLDRLARVLDDATGRFPALLTGVSLGPGGSIDPELVVGRAIKLPGDREGQLVGALGELVSYLEFEVKNHPTLERPDDILASFAPLRDAAAG